MMIENVIIEGCKECDLEKNAPDGVCTGKKASNSLNIRCVGGWLKIFMEVTAHAV